MLQNIQPEDDAVSSTELQSRTITNMTIEDGMDEYIPDMTDDDDNEEENWAEKKQDTQTKQEGPEGPGSLTWGKGQRSQWSNFQRTTYVVHQILVEDL